MLLLWAFLAIFLFCSSSLLLFRALLVMLLFGLSLLCSYYAFSHCAFAWSFLVVLLHSCYRCFLLWFCFGHSSLCSYFQVPCRALVLKLLLVFWGGIATSARWNYYLTFKGKLIFFSIWSIFLSFFSFLCVLFLFCCHFITMKNHVR